MSGEPSWRSPAYSEQFANHDFADFAQEFLQRNADYRADYDATIDRIVATPKSRSKELEGLAGRWGLSFPHCSALGSTNATGAVVAGCGT